MERVAQEKAGKNERKSTMARMRLVAETSATWGEVEITYMDGITGERHRRRFSVPASDHGALYVREHFGIGGSPCQVCEQLACTGDTLMATPQSLARVIRREYRAMRRAERGRG